MTISQFVDQAQLFFLVFGRIMAMILTAPLLSSAAIPGMAKVGLGFFTAFLVMPGLVEQGYLLPDSGLLYGMMVLGEVLIGVLIGFYLTLIYAAFQLAGQFFSLQMGFAVSQVFDPISQIQIPLIGQFLNLIAMLVLLTVSGLQKLFLVGVYRSFKAFNVIEFMAARQAWFSMLLKGLSSLFVNALMVALPLIGVLFLISLSVGLLAKAAPQMNLLMLGFPINIGIAFLFMMFCLPAIAEYFSQVINHSFSSLLEVFRDFTAPAEASDGL